MARINASANACVGVREELLRTVQRERTTGIEPRAEKIPSSSGHGSDENSEPWGGQVIRVGIRPRLGNHTRSGHDFQGTSHAASAGKWCFAQVELLRRRVPQEKPLTERTGTGPADTFIALRGRCSTVPADRPYSGCSVLKPAGRQLRDTGAELRAFESFTQTVVEISDVR
jgi:hypothetical protein